jgi:hypothetical protein
LEEVGGRGTLLAGGAGGFEEVGGRGIVLEGGGGALDALFLKVGGSGGVALLGLGGAPPIPPVFLSCGMPPANKPANPGGPPPEGLIPPPTAPPPIAPPPEPPLLLFSIRAALRSFFSESLTFLSFLPCSIDFNKSLLPLVEGGGILAATGGGGGGPGTGGGGGTIFSYRINLLI